jgi:hypothetical protein
MEKMYISYESVRTDVSERIRSVVVSASKCLLKLAVGDTTRAECTGYNALITDTAHVVLDYYEEVENVPALQINEKDKRSLRYYLACTQHTLETLDGLIETVSKKIIEM